MYMNIYTNPKMSHDDKEMEQKYAYCYTYLIETLKEEKHSHDCKTHWLLELKKRRTMKLSME